MQGTAVLPVGHGPGEHARPGPAPDLHGQLGVVVALGLGVPTGLLRPDEGLAALVDVGGVGGDLLGVKGDMGLIAASGGEVADGVDQD